MKRYIIKATFIVTVLLFVLGSQPGWAKDINSKVGTSSFPFLKINIGARAVGMGGAFTGLANDESALYYNPAGISSYEEDRFILGYHNYFVDMQSGFLGYIHPVREGMFLSGWISYLNYGEFIQTDSFGTITGTFGGGDLLAAVSLSVKQGYNLTLGGTVKLIYERIQDFSATGFAVDLGVKYSANRDRLGLGMMIQNLGKQLSAFDEEKYRLPLTLRGGVSLRPRAFPLILATDLIIPVDNDAVLAIGTEYYEFKPFYARIGWNSFGSNFRGADSDDSWAGLSLGVGFDIKKMHLSYAFSPSADLGESHRVTLTGGL